MAGYLAAIADPVRLAITRYLAEHGPASLGELADHAGVHPNTARSHVLALEQAGLVGRESRSRGGRGRPSTWYRLAEQQAISMHGFLPLAELLATALVTLRASPRDLRAVGRDWGRYLLGRPGDRDYQRELPRILETLGFQAGIADGELRLSGCPCPFVAPDRPQLVCELTAGVIDGVLAGSRSGLRVGRRRNDPGSRRCSAALHPHRVTS